MKLSDTIRIHQEDYFPSGVAECAISRLYGWQRAAESLETLASRQRVTIWVFTWIIVGLLVALLYAGFSKPATVAQPIADPTSESWPPIVRAPHEVAA